MNRPARQWLLAALLSAAMAGAPDVVNLIHWGAGFYCVNPVPKEPAGDPLGRKVHSQTIEQVACDADVRTTPDLS